MEQQVGCNEHAQQTQHDQITPVFACHNFAQARNGQHQWHCNIKRSNDACWKVSAEQDRGTANHPKAEQDNERPAHNGHPPGPVGNRGQQKPCNNGAQIAEKELMGVPRDRIKRNRQLDVPGNEWYPEQHKHDCPDCAGEEERPEPITE